MLWVHGAEISEMVLHMTSLMVTSLELLNCEVSRKEDSHVWTLTVGKHARTANT